MNSAEQFLDKIISVLKWHDDPREALKQKHFYRVGFMDGVNWCRNNEVNVLVRSFNEAKSNSDMFEGYYDQYFQDYLESQDKIKVLVDALRYIAENKATSDDIVYCVKAEEALKKIAGKI